MLGAILKNRGLYSDTMCDTLTQEGGNALEAPLGSEYICTHNSTQPQHTFHILTHHIQNSHKIDGIYFFSSDFQDLRHC